jgi:hypothetical protein
MIMSTQMIRTAWHDLLAGHGSAGPAPAGLPGQTATRPAARPRAATAAPHWLTWRRLPPGLELITLGAGYAAPSLVRLALPAARHAAFAHAAELYHAEQQLRLNVEPYLNHLVSAHAALAMLTGYYYGTLHFILTPLVLAWLYLRKPAAFPRLRSALVLSTIGANIVFLTWPVAPPRFAVPGMNDILVSRDILGSADPHGVTSAVNLYAAMPSLHICWAAWCAAVVVTVTRSRWRHLAWLYPAATTFVVLASANHFVLDVIGGLTIAALGMAATRIRQVRAAGVLRSPGAGFQAAPPSPDADSPLMKPTKHSCRGNRRAARPARLWSRRDAPGRPLSRGRRRAGSVPRCIPSSRARPPDEGSRSARACAAPRPRPPPSPRRAKFADRCRCAAASTFTANAPRPRMARSVWLSRSKQTSTSGGSSDSEVTALAVVPTGLPSAVSDVITVTPVTKWPMACRNSVAETCAPGTSPTVVTS